MLVWQAGAIQPLVAMLYSDVREAQVRECTSCVMAMPGLGLRSLCQWRRVTDSVVCHAQLSAAGALQNLCVNASNKKTVAAAGGVEALMSVVCSILCAFCHVCWSFGHTVPGGASPQTVDLGPSRRIGGK